MILIELQAIPMKNNISKLLKYFFNNLVIRKIVIRPHTHSAYLFEDIGCRTL